MAYKFNADLVTDVALRRIVVFVGAGVSKWADPVDGSSFKDWPEFLRHANSKVGSKVRRKVIEGQIVERDYLMASELLKGALDDKWITLLSQEFQKVAEVSRLHKAIIDLRPRIVITTNFDKLIETAWNTASSGYYPNVLSTIDSSVFKLFRDEGNYLLKIHGSIDIPSGIVFDKSSYQRDAFSNRYYADLLSTL